VLLEYHVNICLVTITIITITIMTIIVMTTITIIIIIVIIFITTITINIMTFGEFKGVRSAPHDISIYLYAPLLPSVCSTVGSDN
jgi:hypothetical protein